MEFLVGLGVLAVLAVIGIPLLILLAVFVARRYKIASPNEALIIVKRGKKSIERKAEAAHDETLARTGDKDAALDAATLVEPVQYNQRVIVGGGTFVKPFFEKAYRLPLSSRKISVRIAGAVSQQGIKLNLDAVAIVKVGGNQAYVQAAAQRFLGQEDDIETFTTEVLAGSLRAIVGTLTVDQIIRDRVAFASKVEEEAKASLENQGLVLDTFQIQDVTDDNNYLRDLGRPEAAAAAKNAAIAEANAQREAAEAEAVAAALTAEAQRDLALKQAEFKADQDKASATADAAGALARAEREQEVLSEQEKVAERQAALTERKLDTEIRRPADAARYQAEQEAQAKRNAQVFASEGEKAAAVARAEAEAAAIRTRAEAELERRRNEAEAVRLEGEAEAAAISAKGEAEAGAMQKRADAFERYGKAAVTQMAIDVLPQVAREVAAPMGNIKDMTVISNDGAGQLSRTVGSNLQETLEVVKRTTGIDIAGMVAGFTDSDAGTGAKKEPFVVEAQKIEVKDDQA